MSNEQQPVENLAGQMSIEDAAAADPGNSSPDVWTDDLTDDEYGRAADAVNTIAVDLPRAG
jgi:hypothetical protein